MTGLKNKQLDLISTLTFSVDSTTTEHPPNKE
jgi:hypothetical protein